jgi:3-oxoacyl-[acyl-carrier protein] reductase
MDLGLRGRKAIVTGGSKGIGRAIAQLLVDEGADVAICARGKEAVDAAVAELSAAGTNVIGDAVDVTDPAAFPEWIGSAIERLGGLDTLILNASVQPSGDDDDTWELTFNSDVMQAVRAVRVAQPHLAASDMGGSVVALSSMTALQPNVGPGQIPYSTMKAALLALNGKVALTLARDGVRMNVVTPGCIEFPGGVWAGMRQAMPPMVEGVAKQAMLGRLGAPEEVANAVVFLASPRASYVTASSLRVDGGITKAIDW